ncbi:MAG: hypothetical protein KIS87_08450 [Phycisphaeraceae bacterium]|nr:hypothetical protein [Phycisphaeraceae bacterium]
MLADTDRLREYLAERDEPCPSCGYNLRGLAGQACPECGLGLTLRVGLTEPATGALIATIVGLAVGAGWSGSITALYVVFSLGHGGWASFWEWSVLVPTFLFLGTLTALLGSRAGRSWFRRRSQDKRALLVVAAWTATVVSLILFAISVV